MVNRPLNSFVPTVYKDVVEMDDIINAQQMHMDTAKHEMHRAFANTFVLTADMTGITMFEQMLSIVANPNTEDLEFRRQRVLNRLSMSPPFTYRFLKQRLDEIIGPGMWTASIDFDSYTLFVQASASNQNWYTEMEFTINRIKPCNMVFTNVPFMACDVNLSEEVSYRAVKWMYKLGAWKLAEHPFAIVQKKGVAKMADTTSIQPALLNDTAEFVADDVAYVILNNNIRVDKFSRKQVSGNTIYIEYYVTPDITTLLTNIKLMSADDKVLTQAPVYVPVTQTVISKHIITVKEGT